MFTVYLCLNNYKVWFRAGVKVCFLFLMIIHMKQAIFLAFNKERMITYQLMLGSQMIMIVIGNRQIIFNK